MPGSDFVRRDQSCVPGSLSVVEESERMMRYDDPNVAASAVVGVISAIALFVIIVLLQTWFYRAEEDERYRKVYSQPYQELQKVDNEQLERLGSFGWISEGDGVAHIPIEHAMQLVAEEAAVIMNDEL